MKTLLGMLLLCASLAVAARPPSPPAADTSRVAEAAVLLEAVRRGADAATFARASAQVDTLLDEHVPGADALDGWRRLIEHRFAAALAAATRARAAGDDSVLALASQADALVELGRYDEAAAVVQSLLDRHDGIAALARASHLRMLFGDLEGALTLARDALARAAGGVDRAWLMLDLAELELMAGQAATALELGRAAVGDAPVPALMLQARAQAALGAPRVALALWRAVDAHGPRVDALVETWKLAAALGDAALAVRTAALLDGLARLDATQGGRDRRSFAEYRGARGEWDDARALAAAEYAVRPDVYGAAQLAWTLAACGRLAAARELAQRALGAGTADPMLRWRAGRVAMAAGDPHGATVVADALRAEPWLARSATALAAQP